MKARHIVFLAAIAVTQTPQAEELSLNSIIDDELLPVGRQVVIAETRIGSGTTWFNNQGQEQPLYSELNNLPVNALLAMPPPPNLGVTQLKSQLSGQRVNFTYGYGISDNLTIGLIAGWGRLTNQVDFSVAGASIPNAADLVQAALSSAPYGYKRLATTTTEGILDPQIGMRWRIAQSENTSVIITPAFRISMAAKDDPDNLMDVHLTDGSSALILAAEQRYRTHPVTLRASIQYTHPLSDKVRARPFAAGSALLIPQANTETVERKMGDLWKMELESARRWDRWRALARIEYSHTFSARYTSPSGQSTSGLEANTEGWDVVARAGVSWNRFDEYLARHSGLPVMLNIEYSSMLRGRNVAQSDNVYLTAMLPF